MPSERCLEESEINNFHAHAVRQIDHVGGFHRTKRYSLSLNRHAVDLKRQGTVELGVPVCIMECEFRFVLHHENVEGLSNSLDGQKYAGKVSC